jgi:thymidylate synthase (FAD)
LLVAGITILKVELTSITPGAEQQIVFMARVSSTQRNDDTDSKLLRYLIGHKHWSPFELAHATVRIETSRAIAQQILRHRSFSFQEFSQRYAEVTEYEPVQLRMQAEKNRQSSTEPAEDVWHDLVADHIKRTNALYKTMVRAGIARECARMILPLTTKTTLYMSGSLRSWLHYLELRTSQDTQLEHREIALAIRSLLAPELPAVAEVLEWK